mgnify:CR=1 FL=1
MIEQTWPAINPRQKMIKHIAGKRTYNMMSPNKIHPLYLLLLKLMKSSNKLQGTWTYSKNARGNILLLRIPNPQTQHQSYLQFAHFICGQPPFFSIWQPQLGHMCVSERLWTHLPYCSWENYSQDLVPWACILHLLQLFFIHFGHLTRFFRSEWRVSKISPQSTVEQNIKCRF